MHTGLKFREWFERSFSTPQGIMVEYSADLASAANSIGASLPADFINRIVIGAGHDSPRSYLYLPNMKGTNDSKQGAYAFFADSEFYGETYKVPIVVFCSFKMSIKPAVWGPSSQLRSDYKRSKHVVSYGPSKQYADVIAEQLSRTRETEAKSAAILQKAHQAAASIACKQLSGRYTQLLLRPDEFFGIPGLYQSKVEHLCINGLNALLYLQSKATWRNLFVASPWDVLIPMFDIHSGKLTNFQRLTKNGNKIDKRFLPGGQLTGQGTFLRAVQDNPSFILAEGYKTARAIELLTCNSEFSQITPVCTFASNNIAPVAKALRTSYPTALIYTATDNDKDGHISREQAASESSCLSILPPELFQGSDWADLLATANAELSEKILTDAINQAN